MFYTVLVLSFFFFFYQKENKISIGKNSPKSYDWKLLSLYLIPLHLPFYFYLFFSHFDYRNVEKKKIQKIHTWKKLRI